MIGRPLSMPRPTGGPWHPAGVGGVSVGLVAPMIHEQVGPNFAQGGLVYQPIGGQMEPFLYLYTGNGTGDYDIVWLYPKKTPGQPLAVWVEAARKGAVKHAWVHLDIPSDPDLHALMQLVDFSCISPETLIPEDRYRLSLRCGPSLLKLMVGIPFLEGATSKYLSSIYYEDTRKVLTGSHTPVPPGIGLQVSSLVQDGLHIPPLFAVEAASV
jgi:hypothetical protein